jgi:ferric-dicitrate binding protein FerR (iron transport regulator)
MRLLGVLLLASSCAAWASASAIPGLDDDSPDGDHSQGGGRAVRLSLAEGGVQVVQDGEVVADPAVSNMPLFEHSEITTASDGRAEIQFEDGSIARLSPNTTLILSVLQQEGTGTHSELALHGGLAYFELQPSTAEHSLRVTYGSASFSATSFSVVRLGEDEPPGTLAVFTGNVHLDRGDALQLDVHGGESLTLDPNELSHYSLSSAIEPDSWDSWNADRDRALNSEVTNRTEATDNLKSYSSDSISDLDANGNWYDVPGQGYVWSPYDAQSAGESWDPYGYGSWVSYPQYGYVWVSGYPWGYTPFQCGLWNYYASFGWGWVPGGGCSPWWGYGGFYGGGWGYRLGNYPPWYHPPHRPVGGPIHPRPIPAPHNGQGPIRIIHRGPSAPIIAVDRRNDIRRSDDQRSPDQRNTAQRGPGGVNTIVRRPSGPVTIDGQTVQPLRPVLPRQIYTHPESGFINRSAPGAPVVVQAPGAPRPTSPPVMPARPVGGQYPSRPAPPPPNRPAPVYTPPPSRPAPVYMPPSRPPMSSPPPAPHSAPPPAPHK